MSAVVAFSIYNKLSCINIEKYLIVKSSYN